MAGGFLQTAAAQAHRKLVQGKQIMLDADREKIFSFLSNKEDSKYTPRSGEITEDRRLLPMRAVYGFHVGENLSQDTSNFVAIQFVRELAQKLKSIALFILRHR